MLPPAATPVDDVPAHFVGGGVVGLALAAITGAALVWLLQHPRPATHRDGAAGADPC